MHPVFWILHEFEVVEIKNVHLSARVFVISVMLK